jgi:hypothetical protein
VQSDASRQQPQIVADTHIFIDRVPLLVLENINETFAVRDFEVLAQFGIAKVGIDEKHATAGLSK